MSTEAWVTLPDGSRRWGTLGAAGILLRVTALGTGEERFLLAHRSPHTHGGACWGIPGGAIHEDETPWAAALREFSEEIDLRCDPWDPTGATLRTYPDWIHTDDHGGGWAYTTHVAQPVKPPGTAMEFHPRSWEHDAVGLFTRYEIGSMRLHPALRAALPDLFDLIDGSDT